MEEAARLLLSIAQSGPQRTGMLIPESALHRLGGQLLEQLWENLSVPVEYVNGVFTRSEEGEYPRMETGDLRNSIQYKLIPNGIELGYTKIEGHDSEAYGEELHYDMGRKGPANLVHEEGSTLLDQVFGVGNYTISEHPYRLIEV
jgi:hypothetical protein